MLQLSAKLFNVPVMSLRSGGPVGTAVSPLINPNNLQIEGWFAADRFSKQTLILPAGEVREINYLGLAVNDHDAMTDSSELVRLKKVIKIDYQLLGKQVVTDKKRKLGKVSDFAFEPQTFLIQKLYVSPRGLKGLAGNDLLIGRNQIVKTTDKAIVVRDTDLKIRANELAKSLKTHQPAHL